MLVDVLLFILWFTTIFCFVIYIYYDSDKYDKQCKFNNSIKALADSLKDKQEEQMRMIETLSQLYFDKKEETDAGDKKKSKPGRVRKSNAGSDI